MTESKIRKMVREAIFPPPVEETGRLLRAMSTILGRVVEAVVKNRPEIIEKATLVSRMNDYNAHMEIQGIVNEELGGEISRTYSALISLAIRYFRLISEDPDVDEEYVAFRNPVSRSGTSISETLSRFIALRVIALAEGMTTSPFGMSAHTRDWIEAGHEHGLRDLFQEMLDDNVRSRS